MAFLQTTEQWVTNLATLPPTATQLEEACNKLTLYTQTLLHTAIGELLPMPPSAPTQHKLPRHLQAAVKQAYTNINSAKTAMDNLPPLATPEERLPHLTHIRAAKSTITGIYKQDRTHAIKKYLKKFQYKYHKTLSKYINKS